MYVGLRSFSIKDQLHLRNIQQSFTRGNHSNYFTVLVEYFLILSLTAEYEPKWPCLVNPKCSHITHTCCHVSYSLWPTVMFVFMNMSNLLRIIKVLVFALCHPTVLHSFCLPHSASGAVWSQRLSPTQHPHELYRDMGGLWKSRRQSSQLSKPFNSEAVTAAESFIVLSVSLIVSPPLSPYVSYYVHTKPAKSQNTFFIHLAFSPFRFSFTVRNWACQK